MARHLLCFVSIIMKRGVVCAGGQIPQELRRMAARNNAITSGQVASCRELTVHQGPVTELHALAVSTSGSLAIAKHNGSLVLSRISDQGAAAGSLLSQTLWTISAPPAPQPWKYAHVLLRQCIQAQMHQRIDLYAHTLAHIHACIHPFSSGCTHCLHMHACQLVCMHVCCQG